MPPLQSTIDIRAADPEPKTKLLRFFADSYSILCRCVQDVLTRAATAIRDTLLTLAAILYRCVQHVLTLAATAILDTLLAPLHHLWNHYYPRIAFVEERVVVPPSALSFIITVFLAFAGIRSQSQPDFPFITHPHLVRFSINSLVMYGLSCAAELVASVQKQRTLRI